MTVKDAILQIQLRADKWDDNSLVKSFVKIGPLIPLLDSENNQIIFGRRGTGKTHVDTLKVSKMGKVIVAYF